MSALSGASASPTGGAMRSTTASSASRDALAGLRRGQDRLVGGDRERLLDLVAHALGVGGGQVDLVDDRDDLEVRVHRQQRVGDRLRLDALRGVDDEQHALARLQRARDLVGEVDVARRVDEVQRVRLAVVGRRRARGRPAP